MNDNGLSPFWNGVAIFIAAAVFVLAIYGVYALIDSAGGIACD